MIRMLTSMILILSFIFSLTGCTTVVKKYVYVESKCPHLETLKKVDDISVTVDANGSITPESVDNLVRGARQLRKSEKYYFQQITEYNKRFDKVK